MRQLKTLSIFDAIRIFPIVDLNRLDLMFANLHAKFGETFAFRHPLRNCLTVSTLNANHVKQIFSNESTHPIRPGFYPLHHYKEMNKISQGLFSSNNEQWSEQRSIVQKYMLDKSNMLELLPYMNESAANLIDELRFDIGAVFNVESVNSFYNHICFSILNVLKMSCYGNSLKTTSKDEAQRISALIHDMFSLMSQMEFGVNFWFYFNTPKWNRFVDTMDKFRVIVDEWTNEFGASDPKTGIFHNIYRLNPCHRALYGFIFDSLFGGFDSTATTIMYTIHQLARDQDKQKVAYEEVRRVLGVDINLPIESCHINELGYLKACIKESHRLHHPVFGFARQLNDKLSLDPYLLKENTVVFMPLTLTARSSTYFTHADRFLPERWLSVLPNTRHPFASLPFGHGRRMCVGRRFVELEMIVLLAKMLQAFRFESKQKYPISHVQILSSPKKDLGFIISNR